MELHSSKNISVYKISYQIDIKRKILTLSAKM